MLGNSKHTNYLDQHAVIFMYATLTFHNHEQSLPQIRTTKFRLTHKLIGELKTGFFLSKVCVYFVLFPDFTLQYSFYDLIKT